jgi:hypothetical protein
MAPALMTLAALVLATYLAIPISLLVLTLFWVRAKRRAAVAAPAVNKPLQLPNAPRFDKLGAARRTQAVQCGKELGLLP